jgi:oligopeptidase A
MQSYLLQPKHPLQFDKIEAADIEPVIRQLVADAKHALETMGDSSTSPEWANTLGALESITEPVELATGIVEHLESIANTPAIRAAYNSTLPITTDFYTGLLLNAPVYSRLKSYSLTPEAEHLDHVHKRLLEKTIDEFRRHGAELGDADKARLAQIDEQLSQLTAKFSQNVLDATQAFDWVTTDVSELEGMPDSALAAARASAESKGLSGYRLTLQAPSLVAVLTYAKSAALREKIWRANDSRCSAGAFANADLMREILTLRHAKAQLLGFANFADLVTADRMAKGGETVHQFIEELARATLPAFERERRELVEFRNQFEGSKVTELPPWDLAYYSEKMRQQTLDFDEEELRAYFPVEVMLQAVFTVTGELFGIRIQPLAGLSTWDESVRVYSIDDAEGSRLGVFYVDLYPRENKQGGAWMHGLVTGDPNIAVIACNANPPTADAPSLLNHREVETLWHEFGHLLHHCLSRVPLRSLAGTRVAHDFVELPSQIMENWCWEPNVLQRFARHWKTNEPIPARLLDRLRAVRKFRAATAQMRQLGFAAVDWALHVQYAPAPQGDVLQFARAIQQQYTPAPLPPDYAMVTTFSHLFSRPVGYAAGYYAYKWAEVLEADAFQRFAEEGVENPRTGAAWRHCVLEAGDSKDPMDLFVAFRGRKPDQSALLSRLGLLA